jgi:hypothetical protein
MQAILPGHVLAVVLVNGGKYPVNPGTAAPVDLICRLGPRRWLCHATKEQVGPVDSHSGLEPMLEVARRLPSGTVTCTLRHHYLDGSCCTGAKQAAAGLIRR